MTKESSVNLAVVGSIALDTVATPSASRTDVLGGSVSYACAAASFFTRVGMVGVVGSDFPEACIELFHKFGIDVQGLQKAEGKTFRWSGVYERNMNTRRSLCTDLNVFASFSPELPSAYRASPFLFLANIAPDLQLRVLDQMHSPRFVAADTMDLWIKTAREPLMKLISRVHCLLINDSEATALTGEEHLVNAARQVLSWGPRFVIIKKGEHGSMLFTKKNVFLVPAFPVDEVHDPTGAGDAFAGGMMGFLSRGTRVTLASLKRAMLYGTVIASFTVEAFGLDRLASEERKGIDDRVKQFQRMIRMPITRE
ncbi:PfkB family carbohydrate kinase [Verrucomicrobiota bacterium]